MDKKTNATFDFSALPSESVTFDAPLPLDSGLTLSPLTVAYSTHGTLSATKDNAILICHGITADQFIVDDHPLTGKKGWWHFMVGPGKPIDTDKYFVICSNVIGGCMGSSGPRSLNPATHEPYGLDFPIITIADMVRAQERLIAHLGIETLHAVIGSSMGGMQALEWAVNFPDQVRNVAVIAATARQGPQNIGFDEVGRQAIMADPDWNHGHYFKTATLPHRGLAVARMGAHITYMSEAALQRKFGRGLQDRAHRTFAFEADFQVESYLRHQGMTFVDRFDANAYLYLTRATTYFDLAEHTGGNLAEVFRDSPCRFAVVSFSSDWLYAPDESRQIVNALNAAGACVSYVNMETDKGHDAHLIEEPALLNTMRGIMDGFATPATTGPCAQRTVLAPTETPVRQDQEIIVEMISDGARVLDIGCGDGELLAVLQSRKGADVRGVDLDQEQVNRAVARGLSVIQGDANTALSSYTDKQFDYVIVGLTLQAFQNPHQILTEVRRVARQAVVSVYNFGYWRVRWDLLRRGRMPVTKTLPYTWWNTPNIHHCTMQDFIALAEEVGFTVNRFTVLDGKEHPTKATCLTEWHNLIGERGVFLLQ